MTEKQTPFERWFRGRLGEMGIDLGFEPQLLAILTDNDETLRADYLNDALDSLTSGDYSSFCGDAARRFADPSLCAEYYASSSASDAYVTSSLESSAESLPEEEEEEEEEWFEDEALMTEGMDWAAMASELESRLEADSPGATYSTEAIFTALNLSDCNVYGAYMCIKDAEAASAACKPCRHLISGRCLRKDCMFEHDLGHIVCKYWLTVGCALETCPFLHNLPYREEFQYNYYQEPSYEDFAANEFPSDFNAAFPTLPSKPRSFEPKENRAAAPVASGIELGFYYGTRREIEERGQLPPNHSKEVKARKGKDVNLVLPSQWVTSGAYQQLTLIFHFTWCRECCCVDV